MRNYTKETIIIVLQLIAFYFIPLTAGPTDMMGLVVLLLLITYILSIIVGCIIDDKSKYIYPIIVAVVFIPTIFIYYNDSALIHSVWYLVDSILGLVVGIVINMIIKKVGKNEKRKK